MWSDAFASKMQIYKILKKNGYICGMNRIFVTFALVAASLAAPFASMAQSLFDEMIIDGETVHADSAARPLSEREQRRLSLAAERAKRARRAAMKRAGHDNPLWEMTDAEGRFLEPENFGPQELQVDSTIDVEGLILPYYAAMPLIFNTYSVKLSGAVPDSLGFAAPDPATMNWSERTTARDARRARFEQGFMMAYPQIIRYNLASMPRPPREFVMEVDPELAKINVREFTRDETAMKQVVEPVKLDRINWLHNFDASLQFSQAYVSKNWYQGGNSNLNAILNVLYNVSLNQKFHPNLIFDTSVQYKLGVNNAPDDTVHAYNISEDLLQINSKFGLKAARRWYYSVNVQFKTQLLNNYRVNTEDLTAAFLSPGELNLGLGMTYSYENPKKTLTFTAAHSPLSYNLKMCTNSRLNPVAFGIEEGKRSVSQYGSSAELTCRWKITYNIEYFSRMFIFTNYEYVQGDWENTINFNINKFLTTRIFAHLRYQSDAERIAETRWHKWQLKEILSIGFAYKFSRV